MLIALPFITGFRDLSTESLVYLSSEQALADLAFFIEAMQKEKNLPDGTKWIVHGGSYPGSLAAWMRMRYPHLVHGAMSASGPLLAKVDFKGETLKTLDCINCCSIPLCISCVLLYWTTFFSRILCSRQRRSGRVQPRLCKISPISIPTS